MIFEVIKIGMTSHIFIVICYSENEIDGLTDLEQCSSVGFDTTNLNFRVQW